MMTKIIFWTTTATFIFIWHVWSIFAMQSSLNSPVCLLILTTVPKQMQFHTNDLFVQWNRNQLHYETKASFDKYSHSCTHMIIALLDMCLIVQAPVSFFDATPVGRILNRFSSDVFSVDDTLPFILNIFLAQSFSLLGVVVVCCYGLPYIVLLIAPLTVIYYVIQVTCCSVLQRHWLIYLFVTSWQPVQIKSCGFINFILRMHTKKYNGILTLNLTIWNDTELEGKYCLKSTDPRESEIRAHLRP